MSSEKDIDFVLRTVEKRDIRFVRLWFTDVLGNLKSFAISPEELEESFEEGIGFDGSSIDGFVSLEESDMLAFPDPDTFSMLPWRPSESAVARVFCDVYTPDRKPFEGDPRACLLKVFTEADKKGFIPNVGPKIEYFYSDSQTELQPKDDAGYFDLTPLDNANDLRRQTTLMLEKMSIPVQYSYHAAGPSQNGVELRYTEADIPHLAETLPMPCVVKVVDGGSSIGVSIPDTREELRGALTEILKYGNRVVVEEKIVGRELTVPVFDGRALSAIEIVPPDKFDYVAKYQAASAGGAQEICPAPITEEEYAQIADMALRFHNALGLSVYSRSDFILDREGRAWCLEVNTLPGMTPASLIPKAAKLEGMSYGELCEKIIELSLEARKNKR